MGKLLAWGKYGGVVAVGLALILCHIWIRLQVVSVGYALSETRQLIRTLEEEHQALTVEWEAVTTPNRLAQLAANRLGLHTPRPEQTIVLP